MSSLSNILSKASSIPSASQTIRIPTLPGLPGVPLICGANEALGKVDAARAKILELLANKKEALAALAVAAGVAKSAIDDLKQTEQTVYSLQNDTLALLKNPTPTQISSFLNRWGSKLPSKDLQDVISKIDGLVSGASTLNFCVDIPNFKINGTTGLLSLDAKTSVTPNANPAAAAPVTATVVDKSTQTSSGQSGVVYGTIKDDMETKVFKKLRDDVRTPVAKMAVALHEPVKGIEQSRDFKSLLKKITKHQKTGSELRDAGLLTQGEASAGANYLKAKKKYDDFMRLGGELYSYGSTYLGIEGAGSTDDGKALKEFQTYWKTDAAVAAAGLKPYYEKTDEIVTSNSSLIKQWTAYEANKKA